MANVWAKHDVKLNNLYSYLRKKERERGKERQRDACWTALNDFDWSSKLSTHLISYLFAYRRVQLLMNLLLNAEYRSGIYAAAYEFRTVIILIYVRESLLYPLFDRKVYLL